MYKRQYILGYPITVRSDHKSISFLKHCKLNHGRLTRWVLALQEYNITWEYIPGKQNIAADVLSRINLQNQTFDGEKEQIAKVYHIMKSREDLKNILKDVKAQQEADPKLGNIRKRVLEGDEVINKYYCIHDDTLFIRNTPHQENWKLVIPPGIERPLIIDYHDRYGHMGALKVRKALEEQVYIKGINKKVQQAVQSCDICQKVKCNNCLLYTSRCV